MAERHIGVAGVYYTISGEVAVWTEPGGPLLIRTTNPHGDPVELNSDEARDLIDLLQKLVKEID